MNELGELRPSQLIFTFGVGSLVDLPNMSALDHGPGRLGYALLQLKSRKIVSLPPCRSALAPRCASSTCRRSSWTPWIVTRQHPRSAFL